MAYPKRFRRILLMLAGLVLLRGLIYALVIPVNQTPDELHHFGLIKAKQLALQQRYAQAQQQTAAQIELVGYYLLYPESPVKLSLADFKDAGLPSSPSALQIYYLGNAWLLRLLAFDNLRTEIYLVRGISIMCGAFIVILAFLAASELFPANAFVRLGAPGLIAFIPQFAAMNGSINSDKLAEVFCALTFCLIVRILKNGISARYLLGLTAAIGLAILSKRTAIFLIPLFFVFLWVYWWRAALGLRMHLALGGIFLGIVFLWYWLPDHSPLFSDFAYRFLTERVLWVPPYRIKAFLLNPDLYSLNALKYYVKFFMVLYWSFWGVFGYMTIHLHHFWYLAAAFTQLLSIAGLGRYIWQNRRQQLALERWQIKTLYLFAVSIVILTLILFFRSVVFRGGPADFTLTQGRYLFAVILPIAVLTMWGLAAILTGKYYRLAGVAGLAGLLALDLTCLSNYLLLNFYRISPLAGMIIGERENQNDISLQVGLWTRDTKIEQTFIASQDHLTRLDFWVDSFHPWDNPYLECRLSEIQTTQNPLDLPYAFIQAQRTEVRAQRLHGWLISAHMFNSCAFAPIADSKNKRYLLTVLTPGLKKAGSSILAGSPGDRYPYFGNLFVNGEAQAGDLAFRALYAQPRWQLIQKAAAKIALQKPSLFAIPAAYYVIGICYGVLLALFVAACLRR